MDGIDFIIFCKDLEGNLAHIESVTGLAFLGSAADTSRADEWSDHDFFVFTSDGIAESLRQDLTWLPNYNNIAMSVRETEHGLKVMYNDGHVLEFAVFENDWELSGVNIFEVALDRNNIFSRVNEAKIRSIPADLDVEREFSLFLANLLIGTGRFRRGENLSARQFINSFCLNSVVRLATALLEPENTSEAFVDNQNPFRRFENRFPKLAIDLEEAMQLETESSARALLDIATANLMTELHPHNHEYISVVKNRLGW